LISELMADFGKSSLNMSELRLTKQLEHPGMYEI
jgi:hypothetical protein